jgi:hypothetical protein
MFEGKAKLDYRESEPDRVQVKIGACDKHFKCLEELENVMYDENVLARDDIERAIKVGTQEG